jgi:hypothetical protein
LSIQTLNVREGRIACIRHDLVTSPRSIPSNGRRNLDKFLEGNNRAIGLKIIIIRILEDESKSREAIDIVVKIALPKLFHLIQLRGIFAVCLGDTTKAVKVASRYSRRPGTHIYHGL